MTLSVEQKQIVASWIAEGLNLAEVQRRLEREMDLRMTYMDVRFLIDDLEIEIPEPPKPVVEEALVGADLQPEPPLVPEGVSVVVDKLTRPGSVVSGQVTFSDGQKATWLLDQAGQLGLEGAPADYRPSDTDLAEFQKQLHASLRKAGMA